MCTTVWIVSSIVTKADCYFDEFMRQFNIEYQADQYCSRPETTRNHNKREITGPGQVFINIQGDMTGWNKRTRPTVVFVDKSALWLVLGLTASVPE